VLAAPHCWLPMTRVSIGIFNCCPARWSLPARQANQRLSNQMRRVIEIIDQGGGDGSDLLTDAYGLDQLKVGSSSRLWSPQWARLSSVWGLASGVAGRAFQRGARRLPGSVSRGPYFVAPMTPGTTKANRYPSCQPPPILAKGAPPQTKRLRTGRSSPKRAGAIRALCSVGLTVQALRLLRRIVGGGLVCRLLQDNRVGRLGTRQCGAVIALGAIV
jgi:hypothetical protein